MTKFMLFFLVSISALQAKTFVIGIGESQVQFHPRTMEYLEQVIVPIYRELDLKVEIQVMPTSRLRLLQKKGELDAIAGSAEHIKTAKSYIALDEPLIDLIQLNLYSKKNGDIKTIGYVAGELGSEEAVKKIIKPDQKIVTGSKDIVTLIRTFELGRIDSFVISNITAKEYLSPKPLKEMNVSTIFETSVKHYVNRKHKEIVIALNQKIEKLKRDRKYKFDDYLKNNPRIMRKINALTYFKPNLVEAEESIARKL